MSSLGHSLKIPTSSVFRMKVYRWEPKPTQDEEGSKGLILEGVIYF